VTLLIKTAPQAEPSVKLLKECSKMFWEGGPVHNQKAPPEKRKETLNNIKQDCRQGLDQLVTDFHAYVQQERQRENIIEI